MTRPLRTVVTGGGGFLGSRIASMLVARGDRVKSFSRGIYPALTAQGVECAAGDLSDAAAVREALRGADIVFHVASKAGIWGDYRDYYSANVLGTRNVIEACRLNGVPKLVYTSTPSVVFSGAHVRNAAETEPFPKKYLAHYPKTKAEAERLVLAANNSDLATVALRPHLIWGPGDNHLFPRMVQKYHANRLMLIGNGKNLVDTTFVDNAAQAHLDAAAYLAPGRPPAGRAYFVSQGDPRTIGSMINSLLDVAGLSPVSRSIPLPVAYGLGWFFETAYRILGIGNEPPVTRFFALQMARDHYFDISAARRDFGYHPLVTIEEGLERLHAAMLGAEIANPV